MLAFGMGACGAGQEVVRRVIEIRHTAPCPNQGNRAQVRIKVEEHTSQGSRRDAGDYRGRAGRGRDGAEAAISGRAGGAPIYVVAGFAKGGARLVGGAGQKITSVKELKGKRVGVTRGGIQEVLLLAELSQAGLTYSETKGKDVQLVFLAYADLNQALMGKNIDAMMQSEPQSSQAINKGFGTEVIKPYDRDRRTRAAMVMTEKFYKERRPVAEKFMRASSKRPRPLSTTRRRRKSMCAKSCSAARSRRMTSTTRQQFAVLVRHLAEISRSPRSDGENGRGPHDETAVARTGSRRTCWRRRKRA